jgi:hypothetical protein
LVKVHLGGRSKDRTAEEVADEPGVADRDHQRTFGVPRNGKHSPFDPHKRPQISWAVEPHVGLERSKGRRLVLLEIVSGAGVDVTDSRS